MDEFRTMVNRKHEHLETYTKQEEEEEENEEQIVVTTELDANIDKLDS